MGSFALGIAFAAASVVLFGVFAVPTKSSRVGDGMFFQWVMCSAILVCGIVAWMVQCGVGHNAAISSYASTCPQFEPVSSLGGAIWCISNLLLVPIVNCIGIGMCMLTWGMVECLTGWASGRFGLGINAEELSSPTLNSVGVSLAFLSLLCVVSIQPSTSEEPEGSSVAAAEGYPREASVFVRKDADSVGVAEGGESRPLLSAKVSPPLPAFDEAVIGGSLKGAFLPSASAAGTLSIQSEGASPTKAAGDLPPPPPPPPIDTKFFASFSPLARRAVGFGMCIVAGTLSGSTFLPPQYVVDRATNYAAGGGGLAGAPFPGASLSLLDHLFSHFVGIWLMSSAVFFGYAVLCRCGVFRLQVFAEEIVPYGAAGFLWGVAMIAWFIANENLSIVIAYPLVTMGPGIVSMAIGWIAFREIAGLRNIVLLFLSQSIYLAASVCMVLSSASK